MRQLIRAIVVGVAVLSGSWTRAADDTRPTAHDVASLSSVDSVRLSPDGTKVVYLRTTRTFDASAKPSDDDTMGGWKVERQLWLASADGAFEPRQLTFAKEKVGNPAFTADGSGVSFVRSSAGKAKLFVLPLNGGEPRPIDLGALEPDVYRWSVDGKALAFTATPAETEAEIAAKWASGGAEDVAREWKNSRLFVTSATGGDVRQVTDGTQNVIDFDWSPDQSAFAAVVTASADPYEMSSRHMAYVLSATDGSTIKPLQTLPQQIEDICYSPDGTKIAFMTTSRQSLSWMSVLMIFDLDAKTGANAVAKADLTLVSCAWAGDSSSVIALAHDRTKSRLFRCNLGKEPMPLSGLERFIDAGLSADRVGKRLAFLSSTPKDPVAPSVLDLEAGAAARVVAEVNPQVKEWTLGNMEVVRWQNPDGLEIEGLLLVPASVGPAIPFKGNPGTSELFKENRETHARAGGPVPLMVMPHGGPDAVSSERFTGWGHYFAARGYAVFYPNYRGSFGYGAEFYRANTGKLGEIVIPDIESGVDSLIKQGLADPERLVYGGWSWGGYTTAWTIGQTTRYKAAVVGAGVVDVVAQYATSDINRGVAAQWEFGGDPWRTPEKFGPVVNPIAHVTKIKTPTLIIHGEKDQRVGYVNAQLLHRALLDLGVPTRFLSYPREPHGFTEPAHTEHMLKAWADWYAEQLAAAKR